MATLSPMVQRSSDNNNHSRIHSIEPLSPPLTQSTAADIQPDTSNENENDGIRCLHILSNNEIDIPTLKRHFDKVQEETERLETEYNKLVMERRATKKAKLLKRIRQGEQKNSEWKAKIEELKKVDSDEDTS